MGVTAAIIGAASFALSVYGTIEEQKRQERQSEFNEQMNELNYKEGIQNITNARTSLDTNYTQTKDTMAEQLTQAQESTARKTSQIETAADNQRQSTSDAYALQVDQTTQNAAYAKDTIVDHSKAAALAASQKKGASASSGVKGGTVNDTQALLEQDNQNYLDQSSQKLSDNIKNFQTQSDLYFNDADEQKRLAYQTAQEAREELSDYTERYDTQLKQMDESYNQKTEELNQAETILTEKYKAQAAYESDMYSYMTSGTWLDIVGAGLSSFSSGISMYNATKDIDTSNWFKWGGS